MKRIKLIALLTSAILLFSSCSGGSAASDGVSAGGGAPGREYPPDTPWNNGVNAIMETETGYYMNQTRELCLRYLEKKNGVEIFLCPKPECLHNGGDGCTATFRDLHTVNTLLYDGDIYMLVNDVVNKKAGYWLYRAKPDGSALDAVCEICSTSWREDLELTMNDLYTFIIHKGYAFIPYYLELRSIESGGGRSFIDAGIMKVDIKNGKKEKIYDTDNVERLPEMMRGCGDYVYFDIKAGMAFTGPGTQRYSLTDGSISNVPGCEGTYFCAFTNDKLYYESIIAYENGSGGYDYNTSISAIDSKTGERLPDEDFSIDVNFGTSFDVMLYDNVFFILTAHKVLLYKDGEKAGEMELPRSENEDLKYRYNVFALHGSVINKQFSNSCFKVSNGKLYANCFIPLESAVVKDENGIVQSVNPLYDVYSCPIDDILSGKGEWKKEFSVTRAGVLKKGTTDYSYISVFDH